MAQQLRLSHRFVPLVALLVAAATPAPAAVATTTVFGTGQRTFGS
jgi:hypothetical protein